MGSNLDKYAKDLERLISFGNELEIALQYSANRSQVVEFYSEVVKKENSQKTRGEQKKILEDFFSKKPNFASEYQNWYSESLAVIHQLIPNRLDDFTSHYKKPKIRRKEITFENYVIEDTLQGLQITKSWEETVVVNASAGIPRFQQQQAILRSAKARFRSSLFDIKSLVQADLLDSEIEAARALHKHKFYRASGTICGVVLEAHLGEVCTKRSIKFRKKNLTIADFNEELKKQGFIETHTWRNIQFLADIRNKCGHNKSTEPTKEEVQDLIDGTSKVIKTVF